MPCGAVRPFLRGAEDIGTWFYLLEIMAYTATVSNMGIAIFTTDTFRDYSASSRLIAFIVAEHILLGLRAFIAWVIPDIPEYVQLQADRQRFIQQEMNVMAKMKLSRM